MTDTLVDTASDVTASVEVDPTIVAVNPAMAACIASMAYGNGRNG